MNPMPFGIPRASTFGSVTQDQNQWVSKGMAPKPMPLNLWHPDLPFIQYVRIDKIGVNPCWHTTVDGKAARTEPQPQNFPTLSSTPKLEPLHLALLNLDDSDLIANTGSFECAICLTEIQPGRGVTLKDCLHQFCKQCLADSVKHSNEAEVKCPYRDDQYSCNFTLRDREVKALVGPEVYEQHLARSVAVAEKQTQNSFHCKTPDCRGWCIYEDGTDTFLCPACSKQNCLTCQAIHERITCEQYQRTAKTDLAKDRTAAKTEEGIKRMIMMGEAMNCPGCKAVIIREEGCDWLVCTACKMEICWVTKGPRWGPRGRGDTSGGCKCGVNGKKCHPKCKYCH